MVSTPPLLLLLLLLLLLFSLLHPSLASQSSSSSSLSLSLSLPGGNATVYDLLPEYGLPPGLLPDTVVSFSLAPDGSFVVDLAGECYVDFDYLVYYQPRITGVLKYGGVEDLKGIQVRSFLVWFDVDTIKVDLPPTEFIYFHVGWITRKLDVGQFETVHSCRADKGLADRTYEGGGGGRGRRFDAQVEGMKYIVRPLTAFHGENSPGGCSKL